MNTIMWFEIVPRSRSIWTPGTWVKKMVNTKAAAAFRGGIWAYYEHVADPTGNHQIAVAQRIPPARDIEVQ